LRLGQTTAGQPRPARGGPDPRRGSTPAGRIVRLRPTRSISGGTPPTYSTGDQYMPKPREAGGLTSKTPACVFPDGAAAGGLGTSSRAGPSEADDGRGSPTRRTWIPAGVPAEAHDGTCTGATVLDTVAESSPTGSRRWAASKPVGRPCRHRPAAFSLSAESHNERTRSTRPFVGPTSRSTGRRGRINRRAPLRRPQDSGRRRQPGHGCHQQMEGGDRHRKRVAVLLEQTTFSKRRVTSLELGQLTDAALQGITRR